MSVTENMSHRLFEHGEKQLTVSEMEIIKDGCVTVSISTVFDVTKHPRYFDEKDADANISPWIYYIVVGDLIIHPYYNSTKHVGFQSYMQADESRVVLLHELRAGRSVYQDQSALCVLSKNYYRGISEVFNSLWDTVSNAHKFMKSQHAIGQKIDYHRNIYGDTFMTSFFDGVRDMYTLDLVRVSTDTNNRQSVTRLCI